MISSRNAKQISHLRPDINISINRESRLGALHSPKLGGPYTLPRGESSLLFVRGSHKHLKVPLPEI